MLEGIFMQGGSFYGHGSHTLCMFVACRGSLSGGWAGSGPSRGEDVLAQRWEQAVLSARLSYLATQSAGLQAAADAAAARACALESGQEIWAAARLAADAAAARVLVCVQAADVARHELMTAEAQVRAHMYAYIINPWCCGCSWFFVSKCERVWLRQCGP